MSALPKRRSPAAEKPNKALSPLAVIGAHGLIFALASKAGNGKVSGVPQLLAIMFIWAETFAKSRRPGSEAPIYSRPLTLNEIARRSGCTKEYAWRMLTDAKERGL